MTILRPQESVGCQPSQDPVRDTIPMVLEEVGSRQPRLIPQQVNLGGFLIFFSYNSGVFLARHIMAF